MLCLNKYWWVFRGRLGNRTEQAISVFIAVFPCISLSLQNSGETLKLHIYVIMFYSSKCASSAPSLIDAQPHPHSPGASPAAETHAWWKHPPPASRRGNEYLLLLLNLFYSRCFMFNCCRIFVILRFQSFIFSIWNQFFKQIVSLSS